MEKILKEKIETRRLKLVAIQQQIDALSQERIILQAEINALREILGELNDKTDLSSNLEDDLNIDDIDGSYNTRLSDNWRKILSNIVKIYPKSVSIDDIRKIAEDSAIDVSDETIRSQLSLYTTRGWLIRTGTGAYQITAKGAAAVGTKLPKLIFTNKPRTFT
ncbi:hypothetical protein [Salinarimonas soli]|uniref:Uncharacterized protein n=1 Tax=Salinarimonas soli TaxID=1638099 RepID=A0A5B2V9L8_9HYPH|nr:hypothetical protein [Salinarimonas soli]KAA2234937.1 hypothetical protein F0L46_21580 [Salinarimonas soli]